MAINSSLNTNSSTERMFDDIYQRPEEVRFWLGQNPGKAFLRTLRKWKDDYEASLKKSDVTVTMHRAQGAIEVLDRILKMKEELQEQVTDIQRQDTQRRA
jgi:hypothetical protein